MKGENGVSIDSITNYKAQVTKTRLSPKETIELFKKAQTSDSMEKRKIHKQIVEGNLALSLNIVSRFMSSYDDYFYDVLQEANCGLMYAVDRFDVSKGNKFSTYAVICIRKYCYAYFQSNQLVNIPQNNVNEVEGYAIAHEFGITDDNSLQQILNMSKKRLRYIQSIQNINSSLDGNLQHLHIACEKSDPEYIIIQKELPKLLRRMTSFLTDEEYDTLKDLYTPGKKKVDVAKEKNINIQTLKKKQTRSLKRTFERLRDKNIENYI